MSDEGLALERWANFYLITTTAAATLIGQPWAHHQQVPAGPRAVVGVLEETETRGAWPGDSTRRSERRCRRRATLPRRASAKTQRRASNKSVVVANEDVVPENGCGIPLNGWSIIESG